MRHGHPDSIAKSQSQYHVAMFFGLLLTSAVAVLFLIKPLLPLTVLAFVICLIISPLHQKIRHSLPKPGWLSTFLSIMITLFFIFIPIVLTISYAVSQVVTQLSSYTPAEISGQVGMLVDEINVILQGLPWLNFTLTAPVVIDWLTGFVQNSINTILSSLVSIGSNIAIFIGNFVIFLLLIHYILPQMRYLYKYLIEISPFNSNITDRYLSRCNAMIFDTLKSSVVIASIQAVLGWLLFIALGLQSATVLALLLWFVALLPVLGGAIVMVPLAIVLALSGNWIGAIVVLLIQILIFSNIDNVLRPRLVSKEANLNPALTLLAIVGGIQVFGLFGILFGPLLMIIFVVSLDMYKSEYR